MTKKTAIRRCCRLVVVDDHPLVRHGIREILDGQGAFEIVGEASGESEALDIIRETHPDLIIADLSLEEGSGLDLVRTVCDHDPSIRILVSSMHDESLYGERALRAGAMGYINKDRACDDLIQALHTLREGGVYLSEALNNQMIMRMISPGTARDEAGSPLDRLSDRELEVFELLGNGSTTKHAADTLGLSVKTVETYRENIKDKLGLENNNELISTAAQWVVTSQQSSREK